MEDNVRAMRHLVLAGGLLAAASAALATEPATTRVYRIELVGGGMVWSDDPPLQSGEQILFHGHPAGSLQSLRRSDIQRIVAQKVVTPTAAAVQPGEAVDVGVTGSGGRGRVLAPAKPPARTGNRPGENKDGSALFNQDRTYRPDWDGKQVPGSTLGYPNSPNDYKEGKTFAYPAATATQGSPGDPPAMKPSSGELPKNPN
jgi:hypothetical protein